MQRFKFRFTALLKWRKFEEERVSIALAELQYQQALDEQNLGEERGHVQELQRTLESQSNSWSFCQKNLEILDLRRVQLMQRMKQRQEKILRVQRELIKEMEKRKMIEKIKEKDYASWQIHANDLPTVTHES